MTSTAPARSVRADGDLDTSDFVLHVYDATGITTNLGLACPGFSFDVSGDLAAFEVSEFDQGGTDLNSDGDATDFVLHVAKRVTGTPNSPPVNTVPGAQETAEDVALVFSSANGNAISISDPDAGTNVVQVTLSATNGTLTLGTTAGLTFSSGDGAGDASMTFTGTLAAINAALYGLTFTPTLNFNGSAILSITTNGCAGEAITS